MLNQCDSKLTKESLITGTEQLNYDRVDSHSAIPESSPEQDDYGEGSSEEEEYDQRLNMKIEAINRRLKDPEQPINQETAERLDAAL